mmetsp:Transcript_57386/g.178349  ORF Transcript_57386/g.178349 Transcript_57386/m.178349 type:complete len:169 (+) Transcript_57386:2314-2820(+)
MRPPAVRMVVVDLLKAVSSTIALSFPPLKARTGRGTHWLIITCSRSPVQNHGEAAAHTLGLWLGCALGCWSAHRVYPLNAVVKVPEPVHACGTGNHQRHGWEFVKGCSPLMELFHCGRCWHQCFHGEPLGFSVALLGSNTITSPSGSKRDAVLANLLSCRPWRVQPTA